MLNFGNGGQNLRLQNNLIGCQSHIHNMLAFHTHSSHGNTNGCLTVNQNTQFISSSNSLSEIVSANINVSETISGASASFTSITCDSISHSGVGTSSFTGTEFSDITISGTSSGSFTNIDVNGSLSASNITVHDSISGDNASFNGGNFTSVKWYKC